MFIIIHAITVHYNLRATTPKYKYYAYYAFMHFIISYTYLRLCTKIIIIIIRCAYWHQHQLRIPFSMRLPVYAFH